MPATFIGVRHHSPACARLVRDVIRDLRPAHVLIEGPSDMNDRLDELLLGHGLPVAVFTSYRDDERHHASWSPLCEHSPEWIALTEGRAAGADVRFIDLPAWHPAFASLTNRYSDAELRHARAIERLCEEFAVDNVDTLWDHLFEIDPDAQLADTLDAYFDLVRGDAVASGEDGAREAFMARWVDAAVADAGERPVVVVTGGFHRPALVAAAGAGAGAGAAGGTGGWPDVPAFPPGAVGGSYLVPFSFKRLDAFDGYQSGMPSPRYYQRLWEAGPDAAGDEIMRSVVRRLRDRRQPVSTADLVAARTLAGGLARLRGHRHPGRADVLDALVGALVSDALDRPPPWTSRGRIAAGTDPVIVEMVAALAGDVVGRLHPDTPHPPLVHAVAADLERLGIPERGQLALTLTDEPDRARSRVLHRLRLLEIPGVERTAGPASGADPTLDEAWTLTQTDLRLPALIEAGSYGATLDAAAAAALGGALDDAGADPGALARVLFDAALCGLDALSEQVLERAAALIGGVGELGGLGELLATALGLWRHDRLLGAHGSPALATVVARCTTRGLWLVEGIRGGPAPADDTRLRAVVALRDALLHADAVLPVPRDAAVAVFARSVAADRPPDLRGASVGVTWVFAAAQDQSPDADVRDDDAALERAVRGAGRRETLGDFLAGLFAVAREQVLAAGPAGVLGLLDELLCELPEDDFLVALPALRLAFSWFPPRERELIAGRLLQRRGVQGSAGSLLRLASDPELLRRARTVEARVDELLAREALLAPAESAGDG
ncbi:hypothetical protein DSM112329_02503 [Paraconexibacter sp. AEG42_29]|uniref:Uncharacterized protein n=1 Tax=Paraconexibacter sp. AEG42_29 TaxID=2997339 RepID=A0AAU7AVM7_9ACTN